MERAELVRLYPRLFHMAEPDAWPQILRHGLRSTSALLDLFEVSEPDRTRLLSEHRRQGVSARAPTCTAESPCATRSRSTQPSSPHVWTATRRCRVPPDAQRASVLLASGGALERLLAARAPTETGSTS